MLQIQSQVNFRYLTGGELLDKLRRRRGMRSLQKAGSALFMFFWSKGCCG